MPILNWALLSEKIVEVASNKFVVVVDDSKLVGCFEGLYLAMPVEIVQFCWKYNLVRQQELFKEEQSSDWRVMVTGTVVVLGRGTVTIRPKVSSNRGNTKRHPAPKRPKGKTVQLSPYYSKLKSDNTAGSVSMSWKNCLKKSPQNPTTRASIGAAL
ncbi:unnamed protein product [Fraxinus pennsylvanica]|uniref:ribose-5-phosphate isomerase n=1 Tax=Fraxinus pennsylvanica TaxID=56036 RepID=A0AAD2AEC1_9LAMI|nr:unnamed protein product [Fraxinus pennsylvanica]